MDTSLGYLLQLVDTSLGRRGWHFDANGVLYVNNYATGSLVGVNSDGTQTLFFGNGFLDPVGLAFSRGPVYQFSGFLAPVQGPPVVNSGDTGNNFTIKWALKNSSGAAITALSAIKSITYKSTPCGELTGSVGVALAASATGGTSLRYDSMAQQCVYNWASPAQAGCYILDFDPRQQPDVLGLLQPQVDPRAAARITPPARSDATCRSLWGGGRLRGTAPTDRPPPLHTAPLR